MAAVMKDTTKRILLYLQGNTGSKLTSQNVADALGLSKKSVDGSFTSFVKKGWGVREPDEIEMADGNHEKVKWLTLTAEGMAVNPDNPPEASKSED